MTPAKATTTALISVWGATATAKRVAVMHVAFNLITACVAVFILSPMLGLVAYLQALLGLTASSAATLAAFHSVFNILGVLLMWPLASRVVSMLARRFQSQEERASRPQFLDRTTLGLPDIAAAALVNEVGRVSAIAGAGVLQAVNAERDDPSTLDRDRHVAEALTNAIGDFCSELNRRELPASVADALPDLLRAAQQSTTVLDMAHEMIATRREIGRIDDPRVLEALDAFRDRLAQLAKASARLATARAAILGDEIAPPEPRPAPPAEAELQAPEEQTRTDSTIELEPA